MHHQEVCSSFRLQALHLKLPVYLKEIPDPQEKYSSTRNVLLYSVVGHQFGIEHTKGTKPSQNKANRKPDTADINHCLFKTARYILYSA